MHKCKTKLSPSMKKRHALHLAQLLSSVFSRVLTFPNYFASSKIFYSWNWTVHTMPDCVNGGVTLFGLCVWPTWRTRFELTGKFVSHCSLNTGLSPPTPAPSIVEWMDLVSLGPKPGCPRALMIHIMQNLRCGAELNTCKASDKHKYTNMLSDHRKCHILV